MTNALERLVEQLRRLPGIGSKSARRLAYHLVEMPKEEVDRLVETIVEAKGATRHCSICFNLSAQDPCEFCSNPNRDQTTIMVVETSRDVIAIERSGDYKGLYHVLEGALSPMEGIGADDIRVKELIARLSRWCRSRGYPRYRPGCRRGSDRSVFGALVKPKWH